MAGTDLERLVVQLSADIKKYENAMAKAMGTTEKRASNIERRFVAMNAKVEKSFAGMGRTISSALDATLRSTVAQIGGVLGVREIVAYADAWTEAGNKIGAAATSAGVQARSLNELKDGANSARTAFTDYVDLYARLIRSASGVAQSEQEIATATDIVSKAFKAGGASAQEQASGILQLGQALGSGVLQGDELRALRENAPILADAIAKEFKTTIAGLKQLGAEGKLTSDRVFKAILNAQKPIEAQFKATNSTISDAMTRINNEFTAYIGNADSSAGATGKLVEALNFLADNFKEVGNVVLEFVTLLVGALTGRALVGLVAGLANAVVALGAFITAVRTGAVVAGSLVAALGPIGAIAGAAAAAIYLYGDGLSSAERASIATEAAIRTNATALDAAKSSSEGYTRALRNQIAMQLEVAKSEAAAASSYADAATDRAIAFTRYSRMLGIEAKFDPFEYAANEAEKAVVRTANAATALQMQLDEVDKNLSKDNGFGGGSGATPSDKTKVPKKTASDKFREDIQAVKDRTAALIQEQSTVNLGYQAQEKRRLALDLEQQALADLREEARKKGQKDLENIRLSPAQVAAIDEASTAYAKQADILRQVEEAQQNAQDSAQEFYDTARSGFADVVLGAQSLGDAIKNLTNKFAELLLNSAFDDIFGGKSATSSGGWLTSLFKGIGFSGGGYTGDGSKYQPAGVVHKGEYVFDKAAVAAAGGPAAMEAMRRGLKGYANGGAVGVSVPSLPSLKPANSNSAPTITFAPVIDARGADQAAVARLETVVAKQNREFAANVLKVMGQVGPRGVRV